MGKFYTLENMSRQEMGRTLSRITDITTDDMNIGSTLRIAAALERIADILYASSPEGISEQKRRDNRAERMALAEQIGKVTATRLKQNWPVWLKTTHAAYRAITRPEWIAILCRTPEELKALSFEEIVQRAADRSMPETAKKIQLAVAQMLEAERKAAQARKEVAMPKET